MLEKRNKKIVFVIIFLTIFLTSSTQINSALAINSFYSENDILFYDKNDTGFIDSDCETAISTESVVIEKNPTIELIFQLLLNDGLNSVQVSAVMGNLYDESHFNSSVIEGGNGIGYGLAQWSFGRRTNLETYAASKGTAVSDIPLQIEFLLKEYNEIYKTYLDKSDFKDAINLSTATKAWAKIFEVPYDDGSSNPYHLNSVRIPASIKVFELYNYLSPSTSISDTSSGCGIVSGEIIATAVNLAYPKPLQDNTQLTAAYLDSEFKAAKDKYSPSADYTDCGGFVGTVVVSSGVDSNFPAIGVYLQRTYARNNPDKYLVIENPTAADLQLGDILNSGAHTTIYTGNSPYPSVDASHTQRYPSLRDSTSHTWMLQQKSDTVAENNIIIIRILK